MTMTQIEQPPATQPTLRFISLRRAWYRVRRSPLTLLGAAIMIVVLFVMGLTNFSAAWIAVAVFMLALALLSAMPPSALAQGLLSADTALLSSVSGVGKKTAERLVLELQNKVPAHLAAGTVPTGKGAAVVSTAGRDAVDALLALGFRDAQVRAVVAELLSADPALSADALIRRGLGKLR